MTDSEITIADLCRCEDEFLGDDLKLSFGNIEVSHEELVREILCKHSDGAVVDLGIGPTVSQIVHKANLVGKLIGVDTTDYRNTIGHDGLYSAEALIPNFQFVHSPFETYTPVRNSFDAALMFGIYADYRSNKPVGEEELYPGMSTGAKKALDNLFMKVVDGLKPTGELLISNPYFKFDDSHNPDRAMSHVGEFFSTVHLMARGKRRYLLLCKEPMKVG